MDLFAHELGMFGVNNSGLCRFKNEATGAEQSVGISRGIRNIEIEYQRKTVAVETRLHIKHDRCRNRADSKYAYPNRCYRGSAPVWKLYGYEHRVHERKLQL